MGRTLRVSALGRTILHGTGELSVVSGVDFSLGRGEAIGFTGPLDSGWRSALRLIVGLDARTGGAVELVGDGGRPGSPQSLAELRQEVLLASALDPLLDGDLARTVARIARLRISRRRGVPAPTVDSVWGLAGLRPGRGADSLTRPERLRLSLALASTLRPSFVLVEVEPPVRSAPERAVLVATLRRMLADGIGIVVGSRDDLLLASVAARILVFEDGEVVAGGAPVTVLPGAWRDLGRGVGS